MSADIPPLVTAAHLEARIGPTKLTQLLQLLGAPIQGSAKISAESVAELLRTGSSEAADLLTGGFDPEDIQQLVDASPSLQAAVAWVCIGMAAEGKPEFTDPQSGKFVYSAPYERARKKLTDIGEARKRAAAEKTAGPINRTKGPRTNSEMRRRRPLQFADTNGGRGSPGF